MLCASFDRYRVTIDNKCCMWAPQSPFSCTECGVGCRWSFHHPEITLSHFSFRGKAWRMRDFASNFLVSQLVPTVYSFEILGLNHFACVVILITVYCGLRQVTYAICVNYASYPVQIHVLGLAQCVLKFASMQFCYDSSENRFWAFLCRVEF